MNENININAESVTDGGFEQKIAAADFKSVCRKMGGAVCILGINDIAISTLLVYIMAFLGLGKVAAINDIFSYGVMWFVNDVCVYLFPIIALSILFRRELKEKYTDFTYKKMSCEPLIIFPAMIALGSIGSYITNFIAGIMDSLFGTGEIPEALADVKPTGDIAQSVIYIVFVCLIGPVCEEIIFRHLLLRPLRRYGDWLAIIFSAVCFGAFHGNFDQFAYAAFVGVFLALSAVRSNSIRNSILLHVINNLIVCLSDVLPQLKSGEVLPTFSDKIIDGMTTVISFFYTVILWVGLAAFVLMIATGMFRLHNGFTAVSNKKKAAMVLINPLLWVGIVLIVLIFMGIRI